jgi:hypothetical protein
MSTGSADSAQGTVQALMNTVMNFRDPKKDRKYLAK